MKGGGEKGMIIMAKPTHNKGLNEICCHEERRSQVKEKGMMVRNKNGYFNIFNFRLWPHYALKWGRGENVTPSVFEYKTKEMF